MNKTTTWYCTALEMTDSEEHIVASGLVPGLTYGMTDRERVITTVDDSGKSRFVPQPKPKLYRDRGGYSVTFNYVTDGLPLEMQADADLKAFLTDDPTSPTSYIHTGNRIVNDRGMTFATVNFGPGIKTTMHRTISVDFIAVIEGQLDLELDSGEIRHLRVGVSLYPRAF